MSLKQYYEKAQKTFKFRIKTIQKIGDEEMATIERVIDKYRPAKIGKPERLMFQKTPLGFTGISNVELHVVEVELTVPVTKSILAYALLSEFGLPPISEVIQVEGECENPHQEEDDFNEESKERKEALLLDTTYSEVEEADADDHFGDGYNSRFLDYVKKVEAERADKKKIDAPHAITQWARQPDAEMETQTEQDGKDFNDGIATDRAKFETQKVTSNEANPKEVK